MILRSAVAAPIKTEEEAFNRAVTKVVMSKDSNALYFSRNLIPASKSGKYNPAVAYYRNCGMYCFRREFLGVFASTPMGHLQAEEDLEQLKVRFLFFFLFFFIDCNEAQERCFHFNCITIVGSLLHAVPFARSVFSCRAHSQVLEMGEKIRMVVVPSAEGGIDTPEQLGELEKRLKELGIV